MGYLQASRSVSSFLLCFRIQPLRVIKQIMCMFMSANGPKFQGAQQELTFNCATPDLRLVDISYFADDFAYKEERTIWLRLPVMPIYTFYPAAYRNRDQVLKDAEQKPYGHVARSTK